MADKRKVAAEAWYKYPASFYAYDSADANKKSRDIADRFSKAVGGKR